MHLDMSPGNGAGTLDLKLMNRHRNNVVGDIWQVSDTAERTFDARAKESHSAAASATDDVKADAKKLSDEEENRF